MLQDDYENDVYRYFRNLAFAVMIFFTFAFFGTLIAIYLAKS
jgi:hypothetical protein